MKNLLIVTALLAPIFTFAQAATSWGPYWGPRIYKDYSKIYEGRTLKQDVPKVMGVPPAPAPADTLPDAKYKMTAPGAMKPEVIKPAPFYAPSQTAKPLQFFIIYDPLNKKWLEVGSADIKNVAPNAALMMKGVRPYYDKSGRLVRKDGMDVYEIYNLPPKLKKPRYNIGDIFDPGFYLPLVSDRIDPFWIP